jgi:putative DNA primase/helicase
MMPAHLLARLERVRRVREGAWMGRCPAHEDRTASLSVAVGRDGRILLHDFGGCATSAVLAALGLRFADLSRRPR